MTSTTVDFRSINYETDVDEAMALLQMSLGGDYSKADFLWKHLENPFGKSYSLLAWDGQTLAGMIMFMFWELTDGNKTVKVIRPVDGATHPDYRGQGIFKKLTIEGLKIGEPKGDFLFSTPNNNSLPGYLRMGWMKYEQHLIHKASFVLPFFNKKKNVELMPVVKFPQKGVDMDNGGGFHTRWTTDYIKWRFSDQRYKMAVYSQNGEKVYVFYRKESIKGLKFIVILECLEKKDLHITAIKALASKLNIFVVYHLDIFNISWLSSARNASVVAYRGDKYDIHKNLSLSIGDLEGIL